MRILLLLLAITPLSHSPNRFHVASNQFAVNLIGKDGGEKLRKRIPIAAETLNATIDAMPMRQNEIHSRSKQ